MMRNVVLLAIGAIAFATSAKLEYHSFEPPFTEIDNAGLRMVNRFWRTSGHAVVNSNFARLTPDRQSKKGALWSRKPLGVPAVSSVMKFRISGQGKTFFGDGIGWWFVQQPYYNEGNLHGSVEKFTGVGIIFDTFKNTENLAAHRDITILVNDGDKTYEMMTEAVQGCNANIRYHAERADFSVLDAARAKVSIEGNKLVVFIDASASGNWVECATIDTLPFPNDWLRRAHIGITGTTGQLADNHDVISLASYSDFEVMESMEAKKESARKFERGDGMTADERFARIEDAINAIYEAKALQDHSIEHSFAEVDDHINNMLAKIDKREKNSEGRIDNIEEIIKKEMEGTINSRLQSLENQMTGNLNQRVRGLESKMGKQIESTLETTRSSAGGWKLPFMIVILVLVVAAIGLYMFYLKLKKIHML